VLELGAGVGDHTSFFLDRGCEVIVTEPRPENLQLLRDRHDGLDTRALDLETPGEPIAAEVVYCYGLLYHLSRPAAAIEWMAACDPELLLLETCVSARQELAVFPVDEDAGVPDNAVSGHGCRPTRAWLLRELRARFAHAYVATTQPWHEEFPLDWSDPSLLDEQRLIRSVFVASSEPLGSPFLTEQVPMRQTRH
jgi:hypothetical protein